MLMIVLQICKMRVVQHGDEDSFYLVSAFISCERRENLSQKLSFLAMVGVHKNGQCDQIHRRTFSTI